MSNIDYEERQFIIEDLNRAVYYGTDGSLSEWWARLQSAILQEDDFPKPKEVFERIVELIDIEYESPFEVC